MLTTLKLEQALLSLGWLYENSYPQKILFAPQSYQTILWNFWPSPNPAVSSLNHPVPSHQLILIYVWFTCRLEVITVNNHSNWSQFGKWREVKKGFREIIWSTTVKRINHHFPPISLFGNPVSLLSQAWITMPHNFSLGERKYKMWLCNCVLPDLGESLGAVSHQMHLQFLLKEDYWVGPMLCNSNAWHKNIEPIFCFH